MVTLTGTSPSLSKNVLYLSEMLILYETWEIEECKTMGHKVLLCTSWRIMQWRLAKITCISAKRKRRYDLEKCTLNTRLNAQVKYIAYIKVLWFEKLHSLVHRYNS